MKSSKKWIFYVMIFFAAGQTVSSILAMVYQEAYIDAVARHYSADVNIAYDFEKSIHGPVSRAFIGSLVSSCLQVS